jgi:hypothetical protein
MTQHGNARIEEGRAAKKEELKVETTTRKAKRMSE